MAAKKIYTIIATVMVAAVIAGCYPTEPRTDLTEQSADFGETSELTKELVPQPYDSIPSNYIQIHVYPVVPENINFGRVTAQVTSFTDFKKAEDIFLSGDITSAVSDDGASYTYTAQDGASLFATQQYISYEREEGIGAKYDNVISGSDAFFCSLDMQYRSDEIEIEGIDKEQAISLVSEKIDALGLECADEPLVYCIDSESASQVMEYNNRVFGTEAYNFSADENAYLIIFNYAFEGMPISYEVAYDTDSNYTYTPGLVYAVVDGGGIAYFKASGEYYTQTAEKQEVSGLYNVDVLTKALQKKYGDWVMKRSYYMHYARLEYVCVNETAEQTEDLIFEPYWVCYATTMQDTTGAAVDREYEVVLRISALTGELLQTSANSNMV